MLDNTVVPLSTAAEVSSHDDSIAKIYSFIIIIRKDKNTNKNFIHNLLIAISVIFALIASVYAFVLDVNVQSMLARSAAGLLSEMFDTEVRIKTFYIKPDLRIHAEELQMNDKKNDTMFYVGRIDGKVSLRELKKEPKIKNINIENLLVNIVRYENEKKSNVAEIFSSDKKEGKEKFNSLICVDELNLNNGRVVVWNQNKIHKRPVMMDYYHIDVDSIYLTLKDISFNGDTITGYMNKLVASEKSGFTIDEFASKSKFIVSSRTIDFKNLIVKTHSTSLDLNLKFLYNQYSCYKKFVDSIMIIANIRPSQLTLSDLEYFSPVMGRMTDTLQIQGLIVGTVSDFEANNFSFSFKDSTEFKGNIRMKGLPKFHDTHISGNVEKMNFTYQDISEFAIPTPNNKIPLPKATEVLKSATLDGEFYGFHNNFNTNFNLHTNIGNLNFNGAINNDLNIVPYPYYFIKAHVNNFDIHEILNLEDEVIASMFVDISGEGITKKDADLQAALNVERLYVFGNEFENIHVDANYENQHLMATTNIVSDIIEFDLDAMLDVSEKTPRFNVELDLANADLYSLNLYRKDETMLLSTKLYAQLAGFDIDKLYGDIYLNNTSLRDSRGDYLMDTLNISLMKNLHDSKDVKVNCDFFDMEMNGIVNFRYFGNTFKNYVLNYFHINKWADKNIRLKDNPQEFYVNLNFKNTETLSKLLMPNLTVSDNTSLTATFTSNNYQLYSTLESDKVMYNGIVFNDIYVKNKTVRDKTTLAVNLKELMFKEANSKNTLAMGLDNVSLNFDAHNDSLLVDLSWDDDIKEDKNKGKLNATFLPEGINAGKLYLSSSDVIINDTAWTISKDCYLNFENNRMSFNDFRIESKNQYVDIEGHFPAKSDDTLSLNFNKLNISNFDMLTSSYGIDVDGIISGDLQIAGIKEKLSIMSNLDVDDIGINEHMIGRASIDAGWNPADTSIYVDTEIIREMNNDTLLMLVGNYHTMRKDNNLDFYLKLNNMDISLVNVFAKNILSRVEGSVSGDFIIDGSLKKPIFIGEAELNNGACKIDYLNTYYRVNPSGVESRYKPYIHLTENRIDLKDIVLVDTSNNYAVAEGVITHNYLRDFSFNIDATLENFMAMNMPPEDNASFYGTAVASGDLKINGPLDDIVMNINALTMPGTVIDIGLVSTSSLNDKFIVFVQKENDQDTIKTIIPDNKKDKKFTLNLDADITPDASLNIVLPSNMGNINATGSGNIRLGYNTLSGLSLYGDYGIDDGTFVFNFQNLVRRDFDIMQGGTITWTGKANDADINVVGSYRTKSSISSLGLEIDSTSLVNNINVDCILRLQEKLNNPAITFGLSLPNATDDVVNTVFSVIDTTNQAVMSQQIISLLVLGSFSYSNASLYSIGATNYYNLLTSSISSWLSQISKDLDIGVKYTPEGNLTAEEFEVALSTQLFDDRLMIEGNLGMYTDSQNQLNGASNFVGDVDLTFKITNRLSLKMYNHSNLNSNYYTYSYEAYSAYTQGLGFSYSQSFDNIKELFVRNKKNKKTGRTADSVK